MSDRISWDSVWSGFSSLVSQRSADPKYKVGAVIVTSDNTQVLSVGYNGDQKNGPNSRNSLQCGDSGFIHAEINALIKCDFSHHKEKKMYLTLSPCMMCAKAIINADIKEVVYISKYNDEGLELLAAHGVNTRQHAS